MNIKMMKFLVLLAASLILISACTAPFVPEPEPPQNQGNPPNVAVEEIDLLTMESFPVQMMAIVRGSLPDGCSVLDEITVTKVDNDFILHFEAHRDGDTCTMAEVPFEENVALDVYGLKAGTYRVIGKQVITEWTFEADNAIELE
jgi:inhibitor of cysteine peptidase